MCVDLFIKLKRVTLVWDFYVRCVFFIPWSNFFELNSIVVLSGLIFKSCEMLRFSEQSGAKKGTQRHNSDLKRMKWRENGHSCAVGSFIICTDHQILLGRSNQGEWGRQGMWHAWERGETCRRFWWESPKEGDHLKDRGVDGRVGWEWILGQLTGRGLWSGFTWLRIGTVGGLLWMRWWTFGFWCQGVRDTVYFAYRRTIGLS
jgi:hypothetical protein